MLRLLLFAALALVVIPGRPATIRVASGPEGHSRTPEEPRYAVATRLNRVGRIVAPVHINGQGPFHFMLDTGANRTALSEAAARRLGLAIAADTIAVQGVNGRALAPTVIVERLDSGALRFENTQLPVLAGPVLDRVDGILGMDGLAGMKVTADFVRDRITIAASRGRQAPLNHIVLRGDFISGHLLLIDGRVGRVPVKAVIDTGGMHTLGNPALQRALAAERGPARHARAAGVVDATEALKIGEVSASPTIWLGHASIRNTTVTYGDFEIFRVWGLADEPALLIGMDVLGTLAEVAIDYRRRELQLRTRGS
jgi:clan AA aspartic protease (TIGR02281 family)